MPCPWEKRFVTRVLMRDLVAVTHLLVRFFVAAAGSTSGRIDTPKSLNRRAVRQRHALWG